MRGIAGVSAIANHLLHVCTTQGRLLWSLVLPHLSNEHPGKNHGESRECVQIRIWNSQLFPTDMLDQTELLGIYENISWFLFTHLDGGLLFFLCFAKGKIVCVFLGCHATSTLWWIYEKLCLCRLPELVVIVLRMGTTFTCSFLPPRQKWKTSVMSSYRKTLHSKVTLTIKKTDKLNYIKSTHFHWKHH